MKRISIYENEEYQGWFDKNASTVIADYVKGDLYKTGKVLFVTAGGKFVVNSWTNTGYDCYRFAKDETEIAEILSRGGYSDDNKKLTEILNKFEL